MEVYLTNDLLGITGDTTKINASPSLVRMYSSELDDGSRMRYAFGPEKSGYAYLNPTTWYGFGESGFILSEMSVEGEGITVTPSSDRIIPGEQTRLLWNYRQGKLLIRLPPTASTCCPVLRPTKTVNVILTGL